MRVQIAQEGSEVIPQQLLLDGSLKWSDAPVSITNQVGILLGSATNIRRETDGMITAELDLVDDFWTELEPIKKDIGFTIAASSTLESWEGPLRIIHEAPIREVFLTPGVPWNAEARD